MTVGDASGHCRQLVACMQPAHVCCYPRLLHMCWPRRLFTNVLLPALVVFVQEGPAATVAGCIGGTFELHKVHGWDGMLQRKQQQCNA